MQRELMHVFTELKAKSGNRSSTWGFFDPTEEEQTKEADAISACYSATKSGIVLLWMSSGGPHVAIKHMHSSTLNTVAYEHRILASTNEVFVLTVYCIDCSYSSNRCSFHRNMHVPTNMVTAQHSTAQHRTGAPRKEGSTLCSGLQALAR